jgi:flagellar hook assembly protein FlgD
MFELPMAGRATLTVYDLAGRVVRVLATGWFAPGEQSVGWDGRGDDGSALAPGAYVARLETARGALSRRFVRVR